MKTITFSNDNLPENGDAAFAIRMLLQDVRGKALTLRFETGTYHFYPDQADETSLCISNHGLCGFRHIAFWLKEHENIIIDGQGSKFIFHGILIPFVLDGASRVTIRNISIVWEHPLNLQALITYVSPNRVELCIENGDPYRLADGRLWAIGHNCEEPISDVSLIEMDADTSAPAYHSGDAPLGAPLSSFHLEEAGVGKLRLTGDFPRLPKVGNHLVLRMVKRYAPAIFMHGCTDVTIQKVNIYQAIGMGVIAQRCENVSILDTNVIPYTDAGYVFSTNADALHFVNCCGLIKVDGCMLMNQMDDALNVHGIYAQIARKLDERTLLVRLVHEEQRGVEVAEIGDIMRFVRRGSMLPYGENQVEYVDAVNTEYICLRFSQPVPMDAQLGDVVENTTWTADVILSNCIIKNNRARGILLSAGGRVEVANNYFSVPGAAVLIAGDANYWFESGAMRDVTIHNNLFENCTYVPQWGNATIIVHPEITEKSTNAPCFHGRISVTDNIVKTFAKRMLSADSVDQLTWRNNSVQYTMAYPQTDGGMSPLDITNCREVIVSDRLEDMVV